MSRIRANQITNQAADGAPTVQHGLIIAGVSTFTGSVSIGGTLTYEDVTNIDSIGIITARSGVDVDDFVSVGSNIHLGNAGIITATSFVGSGANLTGITIPGGATNLDLLDSSGTGNGRIRLGASQDLQIYHDGSHSWFKNTTGRLLLQTDGDQIQLRGNTIVAFNGAASTEYLRITSGGTIQLKGQGASNANPRLLIEDGHGGDNDFSISQYEDANGTYTLIGQNVQLNGSGSEVIQDSNHKTASMYLDARNNGAIIFNTGGTNSHTERLRIGSSGQIGIAGANYGTAGQVLTSQGSGSAVQWATPTSVVKEQFLLSCDGSSVSTSNGTYTTTNVTGEQTLGQGNSTTFTGSEISYQPPTGTTCVIYEFISSFGAGDNDGIWMTGLYIDGTQITYSIMSSRGYNNGSCPLHFKWAINIGGSADNNTGRQASWNSAKTLLLRVRDYDSNHDMIGHRRVHNQMGGGSFRQPQIGITAIG